MPREENCLPLGGKRDLVIGSCRRKSVWGRDGENLALAVSFQPLDPISPELHLAFSATTQHSSFKKSIRVEFLVTCTLKCLFLLKLCILVKTFRWQGKTHHGFIRSNLETMISFSSLFRCLKQLNIFKVLCSYIWPSTPWYANPEGSHLLNCISRKAFHPPIRKWPSLHFYKGSHSMLGIKQVLLECLRNGVFWWLEFPINWMLIRNSPSNTHSPPFPLFRKSL